MKSRDKEVKNKNDALVERLCNKFVGHKFELKSTYNPFDFSVKLTLIMDDKETSITMSAELRDDILTSFCHPTFGEGKAYTQEVIDDVENELFSLLTSMVEQEFSKV
jgi:hypothetical protein